ncbi:MAG TPA: hypothetical protein VM534_04820 [Thermoanaerobaculia bacterium]|nr:hypothetical protein [Thermoanaerobaculia bacterium]
MEPALLNGDVARQMRRWATALLFAFLVFGSFFLVQRFYQRRFFSGTGAAQWIWLPHRVSEEQPVVFFAARSFIRPASSQFVRIRIGGDPQYTLYFNGREIGGGRWNGTYQAYDVTSLARQGVNRIVVGVRSPRGVGGLLVAVDLGSDLRNAVVSDGEWLLYRRWSRALLRGESEKLSAVRPRVLGRPPLGPWEYPRTVPADEYSSEVEEVFPVRTEPVDRVVQKIRVISGVAVATPETLRGSLFDFGRRVSGRARIRIRKPWSGVMRIRYAETRELAMAEGALDALVVAEGERLVIDPQEREFRYLVVFDAPADAAVWIEGEE